NEISDINEISDNANYLNVNTVSVNDSDFSLNNANLNIIGDTVDSSNVNNVNAVLGSFTDLQNDIDGAIQGGKALDLNKNYIYQGGDSGSEIEIKGDLTINGNGNIIDGGNLVSIFSISDCNVIINNVVFTRSNGDYAILVSSNSNLILNNVSFVDNVGKCDVKLNEGSKLTVYSSNSNRKTASIINDGGNITNLQIVVLNNNTLGATDEYYDLFANVSTGGLTVNGENFVFVIDGEELIDQNLMAIDYEHKGYYIATYQFEEPVSVSVKYEGNSNPTISSGKLQSASLLIPNNYECYHGEIIDVEIILDGFVDGELKLFMLNHGDESIDGVLTNSVSVSADGKYHYIIPVNTSKYDFYDRSSIVASLFVDGEELLWSNPNKYIKFNKILPTIEDISIKGSYGDFVNISVTILNGNVGDEVILFINPTQTEYNIKSLTYLDGKDLKVNFNNVYLAYAGVYDTFLVYNSNNLNLANATVHWNVSKVDTQITFNQIISKGVVNVDYGLILYVNDTKNHNLVSGDNVKVTYYDKNGDPVETKILSLENGQVPLNFKFEESGIYSIKFDYLGGNISFNRDNYNPSTTTLVFNISTANINVIIYDASKSVSGNVNENILIKGNVSDVNGNIPKGNIIINVNGVEFTGVINETTGEFTVEVNSPVAGSWDDCIVSFVSDNENVWADATGLDLVDVTVNQLVPVVNIDSNSVSGKVNESVLISGTVVDDYGNAPSGSVVITVNGVEFKAIVNDNNTFELYVNSNIAGSWDDCVVSFVSDDDSVWANSESSETVDVTINPLVPVIDIDSNSVSGKVNESVLISGTVVDDYGNAPSGSVVITVNGVNFTAIINDDKTFKLYVNSNISGTWNKLNIKFITNNDSVWADTVFNSKPVTVKINNLDPIITIDTPLISTKVGTTAYLEGNVKDSFYNRPVSGSVYITLDGTKFNATIDSEGNFRIPVTSNVAKGYTNIVVNFVSGNNHIWNNGATNSSNYAKINFKKLSTHIVPNYNTDNGYFEQYCGEDILLEFTVYDENNDTVKGGSVILWMGEVYTLDVNSEGKASMSKTINTDGLCNYVIDYNGVGNYADTFDFFNINGLLVPTKIIVESNITGELGGPSDYITVTVVNTISNKPVTEGYIYFVLPGQGEYSGELINGSYVIYINELNRTGEYDIAISYIDFNGPYLYSEFTIGWNVTLPSPSKVD
ncbi:MAG: hypothetical protein Q4P14_02875, partial [Methanobacteriaceae archaeon]|nr:hypothetical protein [Methanobacteriaceae archaeon]